MCVRVRAVKCEAGEVRAVRSVNLREVKGCEVWGWGGEGCEECEPEGGEGCEECVWG